MPLLIAIYVDKTPANIYSLACRFVSYPLRVNPLLNTYINFRLRHDLIVLLYEYEATVRIIEYENCVNENNFTTNA